MGPAPTTERDAWQWAEAFAAKLNKNSQTKDWVAQIELVSPNHVRTL